MSYKSLLTVLTDPGPTPAPLAAASALATSFDAHVEALCLGVDRTQTGCYYTGANAPILQETMARAREEATEVAMAAKAVLEGANIR